MIDKNYWGIGISTLLILSTFLSITACTATKNTTATPLSVVQPTHTVPPISPTPPPQPVSTPTKQPVAIWLAPYLPDDINKSISLPKNWVISNNRESSQLILDIGNAHPISTWVYALVTPFPTILDEISSDELKKLWKDGAGQDSKFKHLYIDEQSANIFEKILGKPAINFVIITPITQIENKAWDEGNALAVIPFESLNPRWKVLDIDGISPIKKDFTSKNYILSATFSLDEGSNNPDPTLNDIIRNIPTTNRDPNKLTTLAITGVTALVRATALTMEFRGITYPAEDIRGWLRESDITLVTNEVSFAKDCPTPKANSTELRFCSKPEYIKLLEDIGTDIVDLSGDHLSDWSDKAFLFTLDLYRQEGWKVFGGGINRDEARRPLLMEHNGNRLAFLSCNAKALGYAPASDTRPGAVLCDMAFNQEQVEKLSQQGYLPIFIFQHQEYCSALPLLQQTKDFQAIASKGAVIVSGAQAHQPMTFEFNNNSFIHYGLGNLFFDQYYESPVNRQAFIDRHIFYNGRHISTELLTIMFIDFAKSRPMDKKERSELLDEIYKASGWNKQ